MARGWGELPHVPFAGARRTLTSSSPPLLAVRPCPAPSPSPPPHTPFPPKLSTPFRYARVGTIAADLPGVIIEESPQARFGVDDDDEGHPVDDGRYHDEPPEGGESDNYEREVAMVTLSPLANRQQDGDELDAEALGEDDGAYDEEDAAAARLEQVDEAAVAAEGLPGPAAIVKDDEEQLDAALPTPSAQAEDAGGNIGKEDAGAVEGGEDPGLDSEDVRDGTAVV